MIEVVNAFSKRKQRNQTAFATTATTSQEICQQENYTETGFDKVLVLKSTQES